MHPPVFEFRIHNVDAPISLWLTVDGPAAAADFGIGIAKTMPRMPWRLSNILLLHIFLPGVLLTTITTCMATEIVLQLFASCRMVDLVPRCPARSINVNLVTRLADLGLDLDPYGAYVLHAESVPATPGIVVHILQYTGRVRERFDEWFSTNTTPQESDTPYPEHREVYIC